MVVIRAAQPDDAAAIAAIYAPHVRDSVVSFETVVPDDATIAGRMAASRGLYPWIVAVEDGSDAVIGYAYAGEFSAREAYRWTAETTIYVAQTAHRSGVGRQLYTALLDTLTAQGFTQAIGRIALPNDGSVRLHEAVGFRQAGLFQEIGWKQERWVDVGYWQRALALRDMPPAEPVRFADLRD